MFCARPCSKHFTHIYSFISHRNLWFFFHISQIRTLRYKEVKWLALGRTATKWQSYFCELTERMSTFNQYLLWGRENEDTPGVESHTCSWLFSHRLSLGTIWTFDKLPVKSSGRIKPCKVQSYSIVIRKSLIFFFKKGPILAKLWIWLNYIFVNIFYMQKDLID